MIVTATNEEKNLLARIMRAEAIGDGNYGMLMVGNVVVNRVIADCYTFGLINSITSAIYQENQFSGINNSLFHATPTRHELDLAEKILKGKYYYPSTNALWFYAPLEGEQCLTKWYEQNLAGRYKSHCYYNPDPGMCRAIH
ncbi:MAG: cell wall hydrolase [bacterium]